MQSLSIAGSVRPEVTTAPRVALVCTDELLRQRIRDSLASDAIPMLAEADDVLSLTSGAAAANAIVLGGERGATARREAIRAAMSRFDCSAVIVIASRGANCAHKVLEAGAVGLVWDSQIESALAPAIRAVCTGQVVVPQQLRRRAIRPALSHREKETLALATAGLSNRQIADRLYLAESTVKSHLSSAFAKLGVDSRNEAAQLVLDPDEKLGINLGAFPNGRPSFGAGRGA